MISATVIHDVLHLFIFTDHALLEFLVLMTDPAVAFLPDDPDYTAYHRGKDLDVYLKAENGSDFLALVWPGMFLTNTDV